MSMSNITPAANAVTKLAAFTTDIVCGKRPCPQDCELQKIFHDELTAIEKAQLRQQKRVMEVARKDAQCAKGKRASKYSQLRTQKCPAEVVDELQQIKEWANSIVANFTRWKKYQHRTSSPKSVIDGLLEFYTSRAPEVPEFALPFGSDMHYPPQSCPQTSNGINAHPQQSNVTLGPSFSKDQPIDLTQNFEACPPHSPSVPLCEQAFEASAAMWNWPADATLPCTPSSTAILASQLSTPRRNDLASCPQGYTHVSGGAMWMPSPVGNVSYADQGSIQPSSQDEAVPKYVTPLVSPSAQKTSNPHNSMWPQVPEETFTFSAHRPIDVTTYLEKKRGRNDHAPRSEEPVALQVSDGAVKVQKTVASHPFLSPSLLDAQAFMPDTNYVDLPQDFTWPMPSQKGI